MHCTSALFIRKSALLTTVMLALIHVAPSARGQGYVAAIAYSQSTGKVGYTARQARTEQHAKALALQSCGAPDAKVWMWAQNEWVAIAVSDDNHGTAGFAHATSADSAQRIALRECQRLAKGGACTVKLCIHSSGMRPRNLLAIPRDPNLPPPPPRKENEFFAAIAFSPSTGKIGYTAARAKTKEDAQARAIKNCGAKDARAFMWGSEWIAVAVSVDRRGVAGFGPGATREIAEQLALQQCKKLTHGGPCRIALAVHSSGANSLEPAEKDKKPAADSEQTGPRSDAAVAPAAADAPSDAETAEEPAVDAESPEAQNPPSQDGSAI